ncbi:MAG: DEAD/DEAH box helicase family protein [Verrucomicrobiales bacterium]
MKLQFDPKQLFQLEAVRSVVDLFDGQPLNKGDFQITFESKGSGLAGSLIQTELGLGNSLVVTRDTILKNLNAVQSRNDIDPDAHLLPLEHGANAPAPLNFSIEMETGTGKTYVYLRTIFQLNEKYGFKKFIIVVPSVAIREGVLKTLEITSSHFRSLYNNVGYEYFVYDSKKASRLRQFALSNQIQILVINIDAFNKKDIAVIHKEADKLSGRKPIEFVSATNPIVLIDEPQSVDKTEKAQEAIRSLNPLCTLRYSATHINRYNLVYSLNPVRAFELRLVKQIVVLSPTGNNAQNEAYVKLVSVDRKNGIKAKVEIDVQGSDGPKRKGVTVKSESDLFMVSKEREVYRNGYQVAEINAESGNEFIQFNNGRVLRLGQEMGGIQGDLWRVQIRNTIRRHLDKVIAVKEKGIKVLSLFFIDKVANYRSYDEQGQAVKGKFALAFEEAFTELTAQERYRNLLPFPLEKLHDGYFAQDKKGGFKDTNGSTQADDDVYSLIMQRKEDLLSLTEPLQFIFSHSALREGWDNPNVFQICTLNETGSVLKKRQEIGRGLRLPVNQNGERVFDEHINRLLVVANESYEEFASALQTEYEKDCGVTFGKIPIYAFAALYKMVDGEPVSIGREESEKIYKGLVAKGILSDTGKIKPTFDPKDSTVDLGLPAEHANLRSAVVDVLQSYQFERHIKKDEQGERLRFKKEVKLDPAFQELWNRIKAKTTYSVEYKTETLVENAVRAIKAMEQIQPVKIQVTEAGLNVGKAGISTDVLREAVETVKYEGPLPDVIAYLQGETELTRSTIVKILIESGRLSEFLLNPQRYMDAVSTILKQQLHKLIVDGIKYEKLADAEYEMRLFEEEEILSYLHNRLDVKNSIYDAVVYDSQVEREFAEKLDKREDIKLFVKLPDWFKVETPIGTYNPDWAIVKEGDNTLYLVRETKSTKDFEKLRNTEAEKIRCGRKHFETLNVDFAVVTSANEIT